MVVFYNCEMALATLGTIGKFGINAFWLLDAATGGKLSNYAIGKTLELGAKGGRKLLNRFNSEKADKIAKNIAEEAIEASKEITGEDSNITKHVTKAAGILVPELAVSNVTIDPPLNMIDSVPYSKRLYGSNFQRYTPRHLHKVKIVKKKRRGRILQDINA